jgi:subtilisin family serine protease
VTVIAEGIETREEVGGSLPECSVQQGAVEGTLTLGLQPLWNLGVAGTGVGVAVIDTGIDEALPDFASSDDRHSRVVVSAVDNPKAVNATDGYGHGTDVAGIIAGLTALRFRIPTAAPHSAGATPGPRQAVG